MQKYRDGVAQLLILAHEAVQVSQYDNSTASHDIRPVDSQKYRLQIKPSQNFGTSEKLPPSTESLFTGLSGCELRQAALCARSFSCRPLSVAAIYRKRKGLVFSSWPKELGQGFDFVFDTNTRWLRRARPFLLARSSPRDLQACALTRRPVAGASSGSRPTTDSTTVGSFISPTCTVCTLRVTQTRRA